MAFHIVLPDNAELTGDEHRAIDAVVALLEMVLGEDRVRTEQEVGT